MFWSPWCCLTLLLTSPSCPTKISGYPSVPLTCTYNLVSFSYSDSSSISGCTLTTGWTAALTALLKAALTVAEHWWQLWQQLWQQLSSDSNSDCSSDSSWTLTPTLTAALTMTNLRRTVSHQFTLPPSPWLCFCTSSSRLLAPSGSIG